VVITWIGLGWNPTMTVLYSKRISSSADWATNREEVYVSATDNSDETCISVDASDHVYVCWSVAGLNLIDPTKTNNCYSWRESAAVDWTTNFTQLTDQGAMDFHQATLIWSKYPNVQTGVPLNGCAGGMGQGISYYFRADPQWPTLNAPAVTSVNPDSAYINQTLDVVITGTDFVGVTAVSFGSDTDINNYTVDSTTQITANIHVQAEASAGFASVSVTNAAGTGTLVDGFEILAVPVVETFDVCPVENDPLNMMRLLMESDWDDDSHRKPRFLIWNEGGRKDKLQKVDAVEIKYMPGGGEIQEWEGYSKEYRNYRSRVQLTIHTSMGRQRLMDVKGEIRRIINDNFTAYHDVGFKTLMYMGFREETEPTMRAWRGTVNAEFASYGIILDT